MMRLKDLTGARFEKLTVIERAPSKKVARSGNVNAIVGIQKL